MSLPADMLPWFQRQLGIKPPEVQVKNHSNKCGILEPQGKCTCSEHTTIPSIEAELRRLKHEAMQNQATIQRQDTLNKTLRASVVAVTGRAQTAEDRHEELFQRLRRSYMMYPVMACVGAVLGIVGWNLGDLMRVWF